MTMAELQTLPIQHRTYLGDGLYAGFDGTELWLIAPTFEGKDNAVCLGRDELVNLNEFLRTLTGGQST